MIARNITGGVDTHLDMHVAAALHGRGALLGIEGTGSHGAGLTRHLQEEGVAVVEVDRPNRQRRCLRGKSDPGGDRSANAALWHIVLTRMVSDPRTQHKCAA